MPTLLCPEHKGTSKEYRENYGRIKWSSRPPKTPIDVPEGEGKKGVRVKREGLRVVSGRELFYG